VNSIYAGGSFTNIGGQTRMGFACLDSSTGLATAWNPSGGPHALPVSGNRVYAGGNFTTIGGQPRNRIACLDATTGLATAWDPNANAYVNALSLSGNTIYAGGNFTTIGGQTRNHIACLDTTTGLATAWDPNANDIVYALAGSGRCVFAGGIFSTIGGSARPFFAQFDASATSSVLPRKNRSIDNSFTVSPSSRTVRYSLAQSSPVSLRVFDVRGRQVVSLVNSVQRPGNHTVSLGNRSLPAGFYIFSLKAGDFTAIRRCALVR
jgi:hypothetical protein